MVRGQYGENQWNARSMEEDSSMRYLIGLDEECNMTDVDVVKNFLVHAWSKRHRRKIDEISMMNGSDSVVKLGSINGHGWNVGKLDDLGEEFEKRRLECVGCLELSWSIPPCCMCVLKRKLKASTTV
ncbi:hypothetical protein FHG87_012123 [Trinorchestia longiramus]|nr:hypothetical protein FHG87_012123 [Trinorchestia longiramus]